MVNKTEKRKNYCTDKGECSADMEGNRHCCTFYQEGYKESCAWSAWFSSGHCTCKDAQADSGQLSIGD